MKKRKIKETLGYDPLSKMMPSGELLSMAEDNVSRDESPSHDISFIDFIDNLLDADVDNRADKARRAQADMLKKLSQKRESRGSAAPVPDLPRSTANVLVLSEAYEHLLTPLLIVDKGFCVVSVNRQARTWFARDKIDLLGESIHLLFKAALGDAYDLNNDLSLPLFRSFKKAALSIDLSVSHLPRGDGELLFQWCDNTALEQSKKHNHDNMLLLAAANDRLDKQRADFAKQLDASQLSNRADLDRLILAHETKQKKQVDALTAQFAQVMARNDTAYRRSESVINKVTQQLTQLTDTALFHGDERAAAILDLKALLPGRDQDLGLFDDHMVKLSQAAECFSTNCDSHSALLTSSQKNQTQLKGTSQAIEEIAGVIDALVFRTNMLALNAAVEAARAGEEGRGFAIIASEVKRVSKSSASISKDMKAVLSKNNEYLKKSDRLVIEGDSAMVQMKADVVAFKNELTMATKASKKIASDLGLMRKHIDGLNSAPDSNAELEHQLSHLISRLQRYIDDVADE